MSGFSNWSGNQQHEGARVAEPASADELVELLVKAGAEDKSVRAIGSGHSFVPFWTDDFIVSLDNMRGLVDVDAARGQATFRAGTKLHELGAPLWEHGLSMRNMGDIDRQSLAGAISTGTHGTGRELSNLSSQVCAMTLVTADGETLKLSAEHESDLFRAAQVSMGVLGIVTEVTMQLVPRYFLHEKNWSASVDECGDQLESLIDSNRHFEFFWVPTTDECLMKSLNMTEREEEVSISEHEHIGPNYRILPSDRDHKFNEIEFSVPAGQGWECFLAVRALMQREFPEVKWPLEYRTLKADDIMISAAHQRETVTISAHQGVRYGYEDFFLAVEDVFRQFEGRPHWGKFHRHGAAELDRLLPEFGRFCEIRTKLDPGGRFLNPFLREVFGIH